MAERRPNILLITTDQQRYDAMGINGNPVLRTPNLDALAASGVNFSRCYVTCPVCIPARRTLLSGQHPTTHGMKKYRDGCEFDPPVTLPGQLRDHGYQTQLVGKLHLYPQRKRFGYDHMIRSDSANMRPTSSTQKENDYTDWLAEQGVPFDSNAHGINGNSRIARSFPLDEEYHHTSWLAQQAVRFLRGWRDPSCPWFLHLSFTAPHPPFVPPAAYWERYAHRDDLHPVIGQWAPPGDDTRRGVPPDSMAGPFPSDEIHDAIAGYYGLINHIDDRIRYVLDAFFEYGNPRAEEPTYILFSSDHGEMLGDHHLFRKSLPYEASSHVPLFITGRNVELPRRECNALVTWEDLMPTMLDLAGVPIPEGLDGHSLMPLLREDGQGQPVRDAVFGVCETYRGANYWMVRGSHKYLWFMQTNEEQLFDVLTDPQERCDLSGDVAALEPYRAAMAEWLSSQDGVTYDRPALTPCGNRPPRVFWPNG